MNTDEHGLRHSHITEQIIRVFFTVYNELGPGFLESVYVQSLAIALFQACPKLNSLHEAQTLNYLRATSLEVGLLVNFGSRPQFRRLVYDNPRKSSNHFILRQ